MPWHVCSTKSHLSGMNAFTKMAATCHDDMLACNRFKRGKHMLHDEEWSVVLGGGVIFLSIVSQMH